MARRTTRPNADARELVARFDAMDPDYVNTGGSGQFLPRHHSSIIGPRAWPGPPPHRGSRTLGRDDAVLAPRPGRIAVA
jgi:hypothetical protein